MIEYPFNPFHLREKKIKQNQNSQKSSCHKILNLPFQKTLRLRVFVAKQKYLPLHPINKICLIKKRKY